MLNIRLTAAEIATLRKVAAKEERSVSDTVRLLIRRAAERQGVAAH